MKEIATSKPISFYAIRKRLNRYSIKLRINEVNDYFGANLRKYGIRKEEIDRPQGRIPQEICKRHYWSPKLAELRDKILNTQNLQDIP